MIRRVLEQGYHTADHERLTIITIYEPGVNKQEIRKQNPFAKRHAVLVEQSGQFEFKG